MSKDADAVMADTEENVARVVTSGDQLVQSRSRQVAGTVETQIT